MSALRIALLFLAFGFGWIVLSDHVLLALVSDDQLRNQIQSIKGLLFVALSAALVYLLVKSAERSRAALQAETAQERDRLAQVLDVSPAAVYSLHARQSGDQALAWHLDLVGRNVERISGFSAQEWQTQPGLWRSRVHPDDRDQVMAAQRLLRTEGRLSHEYRFIHLDGVVRWVHDDVVLVRDAQGNPTQITGAWLDITDLKSAELARQASEDRYQQLFHANPYPMWVVDVDTLRFLSVNTAALDKYGYTEDEMLDMTLHDIRPSAEQARLNQFIEHARRQPQGTPVGEWLHRKKDGTEFWVEIAGHAVEFNGRRARMVIAQDITQRREADARQRLIAQVFELSQEGIFITDAQHHFVSVNRAFTQFTGYSLADLKGKDSNIFRSEHHDRSFYKAMYAQITHEGRWEGEIWSPRKTGELFPAWFTFSAIQDENGRVSQFLGIFTEISSHKDAEERIQRLANYDGLTNLPNRALLSDRAQVALATARKTHGHVVAMQLNVDHFKNINELFGHDAGDTVLVELAKRLVNNLKPSDTVSRLGGDDFIILLPATSAMAAGHVALRLLAAVAAPLHVGTQVLRVTASIGVAEFPDNGQTWVQLSQAAETAVNQAKRDGRNTVSHFSPALHQQLQVALAVEKDLQLAVERQQLVVHYQPQVHAHTQRVVGVEALVRWQHPEWGLVPPGRFIGVAEKAGLIRGIGDWVLQQALTDVAAWQAAGLPVVPVAVNLSMAQFRHEGLLDTVTQALSRSGLPAGMLELELTESVAMEDSEFTIATINRLKHLGVLLSIDDFGTGYSSLSYLKRFAVDKLKIDKSFVDGLNKDPEDEAIVTAVIQLAKSLGLKTIAEGVETSDQALFLRARGCDEFQGYLFSRPVPAAELAKLLDAGPLKPTPTAH
ncbi:MAG: GGDEF domain-containing protein [Polaromonas sp.]|nr:GGDEF domain-containing protein [Polaromonas sp.]